MRDESDLWDGVWAILSLLLGEAVAFLTVVPTLYEVSPIGKFLLGINVGLLLAGMFFLVGLPLVSALKSITRRILNGIKQYRQQHHTKRTKKS